MTEFLCTLAGIAIGLITGLVIAFQARFFSAKSSSDSPDQGVTDEIRGLLTHLRAIACSISAGVEVHHDRVEHVNRHLSVVDGGGSAVIGQAIAALLEANHAMKKELQDAQARIEKQAKAIEHVTLQARTDALTGVSNRLSFNETLAEATSEFHESGRTTTLALFDIDFFKRINDTYGHAAGDIVLKQTAATIKEKLQGRGMVARYGGEEFALLFPGCQADWVVRTTELVRRSIGEMKIQLESEEIRVTCSCGMTCFQKGDTIETLIDRADKGLYRSKSEGRNRGHWYSTGQWLVMSDENEAVRWADKPKTMPSPTAAAPAKTATPKIAATPAPVTAPQTARPPVASAATETPAMTAVPTTEQPSAKPTPSAAVPATASADATIVGFDKAISDDEFQQQIESTLKITDPYRTSENKTESGAGIVEDVDKTGFGEGLNGGGNKAGDLPGLNGVGGGDADVSSEQQRAAIREAICSKANFRAVATLEEFHERLAGAGQQKENAQLPVSVVLVRLRDVDSFSEKFGEEALHEARELLIRTIHCCIRGIDLVADSHGDMLCILLPGNSLESASQRAIRIQAALAVVREAATEEHLQQIQIDSSVASLLDHESTEDLIGRAEDALQEATDGVKPRLLVHDGKSITEQSVPLAVF